MIAMPVQVTYNIPLTKTQMAKVGDSPAWNALVNDIASAGGHGINTPTRMNAIQFTIECNNSPLVPEILGIVSKHLGK